LRVTIAATAASAIILLLILGAIITPFNIVFAKKNSNGGNNNGNANKQKNDPNSSSSPPPDQSTNSGDHSSSADANPSSSQPPTTQLDCSKTPKDPACPPKTTPPKEDCIANPTDPLCPPATPAPKEENNTSSVKKAAASPLVPAVLSPKDKGPDNSCLFFPELPHCAPDKEGKCPANFFMNGDGQCVPNKKCPPGFENHDNDESGTCWPKDKNSPPIICPPGVNPPHCVDHCPKGTHPDDFKICVKNNVTKKIIHVIHITSNNDENSIVTRNTQLTDQLTVGQAINGCKDITANSPNNELKKSCNIFMAAIFNYCLTHTKIANKDNNICSDDLYLTNVPQYVKENVNLKQFPPTIYNIRP